MALCRHLGLRAMVALAIGGFADEARAHAAAPQDSHLTAVRHGQMNVNRLSFPVWNQGSFAYDLSPPLPSYGLEFPKGSERGLAYAAGLWIGGRIEDSVRTAAAEFTSDFVPGPVVNGNWAVDTTRFKVYAVTRGDTAGFADWMARAAPMGAPVDASGTAPGLTGDQTLWTVFNDMHPSPPRARPRFTPPIGIEVQLTACAFDGPGALRDAAFLRWRIVHKGLRALDSCYVGLWMDPIFSLMEPRLAACDTALDLAYTYYRSEADYPDDLARPAVGLTLLGGPRNLAGGTARMTSFAVYPNGADPMDSLQVYNVLLGLRPTGTAPIDSSTGQPTRFWSSGDPVTGAGWVAVVPPHPHWALASGPFRLAPGDTQDVHAALVVGRGVSHLGSVTVLRETVRESRRLFAEGFATTPGPPGPPPEPQPESGASPDVAGLWTWPNPARSEVRLRYMVPLDGAAVDVRVVDVSGRRRRTLARGWHDPGSASSGRARPFKNRLSVDAVWNGTDDNGAPLPAGIYFLHAVVGGERSTRRIVLIR